MSTGQRKKAFSVSCTSGMTRRAFGWLERACLAGAMQSSRQHVLGPYPVCPRPVGCIDLRGSVCRPFGRRRTPPGGGQCACDIVQGQTGGTPVEALLGCACCTRTLLPQLLHAAGGGRPCARVAASESGTFCTPRQLRTRRRLAVPDCKTEYVCFSR